ncbi:uncharacterized protein LOC116261350 [Nymphaea colorata]|nr:uncharacterized protein LOC116261350 [Nymphaea colorata]
MVPCRSNILPGLPSLAGQQYWQWSRWRSSREQISQNLLSMAQGDDWLRLSHGHLVRRVTTAHESSRTPFRVRSLFMEGEASGPGQKVDFESSIPPSSQKVGRLVSTPPASKGTSED